MFAGFGSWVARFRWPVLVVALVAVISAGIWGLGVFGQLSEGGYNDPNSESSHAADAVQQAFGAQGGDVVAIYTPTTGKIDDAALGKRITARLAALPKSAVKNSSSYWQAKSPQYAAKDKSSAVAVITLAGADDSAKMDSYRLIDDQFAVPGATVRLAGATPLGDASASRSTDDLASAEFISLPIVLILLLFIFGSLVAASLPVLVGGAAVLGSLGVLHAVAYSHDVNSFAVNVASLLGLGMAIDYGLFMVGRFREEQAEGRTPAEAVRRTVATAGRTVLFSATLLMIALGGLLLFPQGFLKSLAYGGLAAVALAAILSLTLLPALLAVLGPRVDKLPVRLPRRSGAAPGTAWARLAGFVLRRPVLIALPIVAGLLVLAAPIGGVHFGESDERVLPANDPSRQAIEVLKTSYPQFASNGVQIVLRGGTDTGPLAGAARAVPGIATLSVAQRAGSVTVFTATLDSTDPFSTSARDAIDAIRALPVPAGATLLVGGTTARNIDSLDATAAKLPLMIGLLVGATLILMFLAFGSILLPIKAVLMSALSLSATFGILVWIFQDGHLAGLLDITPAPLEVGIVVLMAAVVFGLSTDYEVFLLSRMVEARTRGASTAEAVTTGLARTGRVISAAALLLIVVTGAFALSSVTTMRFVGVGMITALLLDATVVRMLLVPAVLSLLGNAAWWAPGPLRRLQARAGLAEYAGEELFPTVSVGKHAAPDDTQVLVFTRPLALPSGAPATVSGTDVWAHQPALPAAAPEVPAEVPALPAAVAPLALTAGPTDVTAVFPAITEETALLRTVDAGVSPAGTVAESDVVGAMEPSEEPDLAEPVAEPVSVEPVPVEPVAAEAVSVEAVAAEAVSVEPVAAEPIAAEPIAAEPIAAEADSVEPEAVVEPVVVEPAAVVVEESDETTDEVGLPSAAESAETPDRVLAAEPSARTVDPMAAAEPVDLPESAEPPIVIKPVIVPETVTEAETAVTPEPVAEARAAVPSEPVAEAETAVVSEPVAETETETETETTVVPEPVIEAEPAIVSKPAAEAETATVPEPVTEAEPAIVSEPAAEAETATVPEPVSQAEPAIVPEPVAEAETAIATVADAETAVVPEPVAEAETAGEVEPVAVVDPAEPVSAAEEVEPENAGDALPDDGTPVAAEVVEDELSASAVETPEVEPVTEIDPPSSSGFDMLPLGSRLGLTPEPATPPAREYTDWSAHSGGDFFFSTESRLYVEPLPPAYEPSAVPAADLASPQPAADPLVEPEPEAAPPDDDRFVNFSYTERPAEAPDDRYVTRWTPPAEAQAPIEAAALAPVTEPLPTEPLAARPPVTEPLHTEPLAARPLVTEPLVTEPLVTETPSLAPAADLRPTLDLADRLETPRRPATLADQEPAWRPADLSQATPARRPAEPTPPTAARPVTDPERSTKDLTPFGGPASTARPADLSGYTPADQPHRYRATDTGRPYGWDQDGQPAAAHSADLSQAPAAPRPADLSQLPEARRPVDPPEEPRRPSNLSRIIGGRRPAEPVEPTGPQRPTDLEQYSQAWRPATDDRTPPARPADLSQLDAAVRPYLGQPALGSGPSRPAHLGDQLPQPRRPADPAPARRPANLADAQGWRPATLADQTRPTSLADQEQLALPAGPAPETTAADPGGPTRDLSAYTDHDSPRRR